MGKHDTFSHAMHVPKAVKFKQAKPHAITNQTSRAPQQPVQGQLAHNMYK